MSDRLFDIKAYSQDPSSIKERTSYVESIVTDMQAKDFNDRVEGELGMNMYSNDKNTLPETEEELSLHMQTEYKQAIEIAEEQAINAILNQNKYDLTRKRVNYDLTVLGIACVKNFFTKSEFLIGFPLFVLKSYFLNFPILSLIPTTY